MEVHITSVNCCIPLTQKQWEILHRREKAFDKRERNNPAIVLFQTTWDFPKKDKVHSWEWNGHFGRNIFFTAEDGAEKEVVKFLQKFLK